MIKLEVDCFAFGVETAKFDNGQDSARTSNTYHRTYGKQHHQKRHGNNLLVHIQQLLQRIHWHSHMHWNHRQQVPRWPLMFLLNQRITVIEMRLFLWDTNIEPRRYDMIKTLYLRQATSSEGTSQILPPTGGGSAEHSSVVNPAASALHWLGYSHNFSPQATGKNSSAIVSCLKSKEEKKKTIYTQTKV